MNQIDPATIYTEIVEQINVLNRASRRHLDSGDIRYMRVLHECRKLIQVSPSDGYQARGMARGLVADVKNANSDFERALRIAPSNADEINYNWCQLLLNMGFYSAALAKFKKSVAPQKPDFSHRHSIGMIVGAVSYLSEMLREASAMRLQYESDVDERSVHDSAAFLQQHGLTDEKIALAMDLAGEVVRAHNIKANFGYRADVLGLGDDDSYVIELCLMCEAEEAAEMVYELSEKLADLDADDSYHALHITFEAYDGNH